MTQSEDRNSALVLTQAKRRSYSALVRSILNGWPRDQMDIVNELIQWPVAGSKQDEFVAYLVRLTQARKERDVWHTAETARDMLEALCETYARQIIDGGAPAGVLPDSLAAWALLVAAGKIEELPKIGRRSDVLRDLKLLWIVDKIQADLQTSRAKAEDIAGDGAKLKSLEGVRAAARRGELAKNTPLGEAVFDMLRHKYGGRSFNP